MPNPDLKFYPYIPANPPRNMHEKNALDRLMEQREMPNPDTLRICEYCNVEIREDETYKFDQHTGQRWHRVCPQEAARLATIPTLESIRLQSGSFRRMMESYWTGALTPEQEAVIEDKFPKETLVSYRPVEIRWTDQQATAMLLAALPQRPAAVDIAPLLKIPHEIGCPCLLCKNGIR